MKTLPSFLVLGSFLLLVAACQKEAPQIEPIDPPVNNELQGEITLEVSNKAFTEEEQFLVLLTNNDGMVNTAEVDYSGNRPVMLDYEEWKEEGSLVDTFYASKGSNRIQIEVALGNYFTHLYDLEGDKSVEYFTLTDSRRKDERFTETNTLGHLKVHLRETPIKGSEIDSSSVYIYQGDDEKKKLIINTPLAEMPFAPERTVLISFKSLVSTEAISLNGECVFFNLPSGSYIAAGFYKDVWPEPNERNKSVTRVYVQGGKTSSYSISFY